ncbi:MAG TPA: sugar phosphate isomerase/epimerase family protein [Syntrophorhabdaceae bacterium]|jgi:sugar phosphate isomerase/epimerase
MTRFDTPAGIEPLWPLGTYSYFGYPLSFSQRCDVIREAGFEVTSLGLGDEEDLVRAGQEDMMPVLARERGLAVDYVHCAEGRCNLLWSPSEREREVGLKDLLRAVAFCAKHSIAIVVAHITRSKGEQPPPPNRHGIDALSRVIQKAEDNGIRIAVENTQKPGHLHYLFSRIASPCLGLCYDSSHDFLYSASPGELLRQWGHLLLAVHISDNDGLADRHWLPGEGVIDWKRVISLFPPTYRGTLNLEIFPKEPGVEAPPAFLTRAYAGLRRLQEQLNGAHRPE